MDKGSVRRQSKRATTMDAEIDEIEDDREDESRETPTELVGDEARKLYHQLLPVLEKAGFILAMDGTLLINYCNITEKVNNLQKTIREYAFERDKKTNNLVGNKLNPSLNALTMQQQNLAKVLGIGLRNRLAIQTLRKGIRRKVDKSKEERDKDTSNGESGDFLKFAGIR